MKTLLLLIFVILFCPSLSRAAATSKDSDQRILTDLGTFLPSFYWVMLQNDDAEPKNQKVLGMNDEVLAKVSQSFFKNLNLEGTGKLLDGRVLNFGKRIKLPDGSMEIRYRVCPKDAPYGYGYEDRALLPFHTIAVDPKVIPLDSKIYIPEVKGAVLPDGSIHDGIFHALDIGAAIQDKRIDIFTAFGDQSSVFEAVGVIHMRPVHVYLVGQGE